MPALRLVEGLDIGYWIWSTSFSFPASSFQDLDQPGGQHHHGNGAKQGHLAGFENAVAVPTEEKGGDYSRRQPTGFDDLVAEDTPLGLHDG
jgi:hypothetical protein